LIFFINPTAVQWDLFILRSNSFEIAVFKPVKRNLHFDIKTTECYTHVSNKAIEIIKKDKDFSIRLSGDEMKAFATFFLTEVI
jgi:hypothetical protein